MEARHASEGEPRSLLCPSLVGREDALALVRAVAAGSHRPALAAIVGEAGIGKSALVRAALQDLPDRVVLVARATPDMAPLRAPAELAVGAIAAGADPDDPRVERVRAGLAPLVPGLGRADVASDALPLMVAEALLALLATIGGAVTVVLEDLHWADADTLTMIDRIADRAATRPVSVLLTSRPGGASARFLGRLTARRAAVGIDLHPLEPHEVRAFVERCVGGGIPVGLDGVVGAAGGIPYLIEELLRGARDVGALRRAGDGWILDPSRSVPLPTGVAEAVAVRLAQLPAPARRLVETAAVLGDGVPVPLLAACAGIDGADAFDDARQAGVDHQLLAAEPPGVALRHALAADAVLQGISSSSRRTIAAQALQAVDRDAVGSTELPFAAVARWAELAGDAELAARRYLDAARHEARMGSLRAALWATDRAAAVAPGGELAGTIVVERAELLALAGQAPDADAVAEGGLGLGSLASDLRARLLLVRARTAPDQAVRAAAIEQALTETVGTPLEAAAHALGALLAVESGALDRATTLAARALAVDERDGADPAARCQALEVLGRVARTRDLDEARRCFRQGATVAEVHRLPVWRARALHEAATISQLRYVDAAELRTARHAALEAAAPGLVASIDFHLAAILATAFDGGAAVEVARGLVDLAGALGLTHQRAWGWTLVGYGHVVAGHWREAAAALDEAQRLAGDDLEIGVLSRFLGDGLRVLLEAGPAAAAPAYRHAMETLASDGRAVSALPPWYLGPLVSTIADRDGGAAAREAADRAELAVAAVCRAPLSMAEAVAAGRAGRPDRAEELVAQADDLWNGHPGLDGHRVLARWLAAAPAAEAGWGSPRAWLTEAEGWGSAHGFRAVVDGSRAELRRMGVPRRRRRGATAVPPALAELGVTGREVDVLTLIAVGLTNPQIAERLFVSPGTVKGYVSQLLTKTGARNRAGLAALAADSGLPDGVGAP